MIYLTFQLLCSLTHSVLKLATIQQLQQKDAAIQEELMSTVTHHNS